MPITLDSGLQAKLDSVDRDPVFQVLSEPPDGNNIPFPGQQLHTGESNNEEWPYGFKHSTGAYVCVYQKKDASDEINLYFKTSTDDRISWNDPIRLATNIGSGYYNEFPSCCELSTTNIGIVYTERYGGAQKLRYMVVSTTGTIISGPSDLAATGLYYESSVCRVNNGDSLCVAARYSGGTWDIVKFVHAPGDWTSWPSPVAISMTGVNGEKRRPFVGDMKKQDDSYEQWLLFDRVDQTLSTRKQTNLYWVKSSNEFASTPGAATKLTSLTEIYDSDEDPTISQSVKDVFVLAYCHRMASVYIGANLIGGTPPSCTFVFLDRTLDPPLLIFVIDSCFSDPTTRGVLVINADTFGLIRLYNSTSTPSIEIAPGPSGHRVMAYYSSSDHVLVLARPNTNPNVYPYFSVIDMATNPTEVMKFYAGSSTKTLDATHRRISNLASYPYPRSVAINGNYLYWYTPLTSIADGNDLWKLDWRSSPPADYVVEATQIGVTVKPSVDGNPGTTYVLDQDLCHWDFANDALYFCRHTGSGGATKEDGYIASIRISDGNLTQVWRALTYGGFSGISGFPRTGCVSIHLDRGILYGACHNDNTNFPSEPTGLVSLDPDLSSPAITNYTADPVGIDRTLNNPPNLIVVRGIGDGTVMLCTRMAGVGIYSPESNSCSIVYDEVTQPGFILQTVHGYPMPVSGAVYDSATSRFIFCMDTDRFIDPVTIGGVLIFDKDGDIVELEYLTMSALLAGPTPSAAAPLTIGGDDSEPCLLLNGAGNGIAAFWSRRANIGTEQNLMFDEETGSVDISKYVRGQIKVSQSIEHQPNRADFSVVPADLFDPLNSRSLLSSLLDSGRRITIKKGEVVSGSPILDNLFVGYVESGAHSYNPTQMSERSTICYDITKPSYDSQIQLSPSFGDGSYPTYPDGNDPDQGILAWIAHNLMNIPVADINFGSFGADRFAIEVQLVNMSPADMLELVANRFHRVTYVDSDGKITCCKIDLSASATDTFSDHKLTTEMNPDEGEGESTNRVTVRGISTEESLIVFPEEMLINEMDKITIKNLVGFISFVYRIHYDRYWPYDDSLSITAINPRMAPSNYSFSLGGGTPISGQMPSLFVVKPYTPDECVAMGLTNNPLVSGLTKEEVALFYAERGARVYLDGMLYTDADPDTFIYDQQIQVYASQTSKVKQEFEASADDIEHQHKLRGSIIDQVINFPACHTIADCQDMADWFRDRIKVIRRLVAYSMAGHLKQEAGDVVNLKHPKSGEYMKCMAVSIDRGFGPGELDIQTMKMGVIPS